MQPATSESLPGPLPAEQALTAAQADSFCPPTKKPRPLSLTGAIGGQRIRPARRLTPQGVLVVQFSDGIIIECHADRVQGTDGDSCFVKLGAPTAGAVRDVRAVLRIRQIEARNETLYERYYAEARERRIASERPARHRGHLAELARDIEEAAEEYRGVDYDDVEAL